MTEEQKEILITCCKCHGKGSYKVPDNMHYMDSWHDVECELCHGTGKISLQFYEDLQRGCRR